MDIIDLSFQYGYVEEIVTCIALLPQHIEEEWKKYSST